MMTPMTIRMLLVALSCLTASCAPKGSLWDDPNYREYALYDEGGVDEERVDVEDDY